MFLNLEKPKQRVNTKFKSFIRATCHLFSEAVCAGAVLLAVSSAQAQNLFVSDSVNGNIYEITPSGEQSVFASGLDGPWGEAFNSAGNLFVTSRISMLPIQPQLSAIHEFTPGGVQTTFASGLGELGGLAFNSAGDLFVSSGRIIVEITPGGVQSTFAAGLSSDGLAFDSAGNLFVLDSVKGVIYEYTPGGVRSIFASGLVNPQGLAFNSAGDLFVSQENGIIYEYAPDGAKSTFASGLYFPLGLAFNSDDDLFVANLGGEDIIKITPDGVQSTFASGLEPDGLAFQPVPEPSVFGLLAIGGTALLVHRRCTIAKLR
jgi:glucose/arabinose dehydrogenase